MQQAAFCFEASKDPRCREKHEPIPIPKFREGHTEQLFVGNTKLSTYLTEHKFGLVLGLGKFFQGYDFSSFVKAYSTDGRPAIHPRVILGLIVYGILLKQCSLRELENLSLRDVGAWWICGGFQPDHSTIGKFLNQHSKLLSEDFFGQITQQIVRELKLSPTDVAGDGTVVEAAASRYRVLKAEAALEAAREADSAAKLNPQDAGLRARAERLSKAAEIVHEKKAQWKRYGHTAKDVYVCSTEPDAVLQPLKSRIKRPAYKPSILADENRFIVGSYLHPSNENIAIAPMLEQHKQIYGQLPECTLFDAGYHTIDVLNLFASWELDVLCPQGSVDGKEEWRKQSHSGLYPKSAFQYDENNDVYICPSKQFLTLESTGKDGGGRRYVTYRSKVCSTCPVKGLCTQSKVGRRIKRFEGEELKEAMVQVLQHPKARQRYRKRKSMVEPVFAELKERQGLKRFHRKGLLGVKIEFALHCVAYNLKRAFSLSEGAIFGVFLLCYRRNQGSWEIIDIGFFVIPAQ